MPGGNFFSITIFGNPSASLVKSKMDKTIKTIKNLVKNPSPLIDMVNETIEKNKDNLKKTVDTIETTYSGTLLLLSFHSL